MSWRGGGWPERLSPQYRFMTNLSLNTDFLSLKTPCRERRRHPFSLLLHHNKTHHSPPICLRSLTRALHTAVAAMGTSAFASRYAHANTRQVFPNFSAGSLSAILPSLSSSQRTESPSSTASTSI